MIISDIMMPVMDGLSMVKEIRKTSRSVPIILLTAFESVDYLMSAINANVDKYLVKPFRINALLESLLSCAHHVRVERELEQSEEGLRQMFQLSADAHFRMEDDVITDCNKAAEKMIGYKKQQMCGLSVKALMPEHQPDGTSTLNSYREHVDHVMAGGDTPRELLLQSPSRGLFWAEISGSTFRLHGKQMFQWNIRDVTIRKESEEKLVSITNSASDAILTMDSKGNILFWNPAATTIFGYTPQEVIGENLHNLLAPPRYHADHQAAFPRFMETGQGNAVNKTVELSALRKDGQEIPIELSLSSHQHGTEWHAIGIIRDISVRKRAEAEAQSLNEKLRMATEAASTLDGLAVQICVLNQNGSIVRTNLQWDRFSREHGDCQHFLFGFKIVCHKGIDFLVDATRIELVAAPL